ncbi:MAG: DNA polymerase ligase N-terminal domain-containing protein [Nitrososphaeria archaeon]|jgi:DNA ligase D-like protein (predicted 3'-phosphoesterase)
MPIFVVQEHWATTHHFDFRLEMDGVLKSWAVPKGVPQEYGVKRLALRVEDHSLEYANFSGVIPEGQYGAGKVTIWDRGTYTLIENLEKRIKFNLKGGRLNGTYNLIRFQTKEGKEQWLIMKVRE